MKGIKRINTFDVKPKVQNKKEKENGTKVKSKMSF